MYCTLQCILLDSVSRITTDTVSRESYFNILAQPDTHCVKYGLTTQQMLWWWVHLFHTGGDSMQIHAAVEQSLIIIISSSSSDGCLCSVSEASDSGCTQCMCWCRRRPHLCLWYPLLHRRCLVSSQGLCQQWCMQNWLYSRVTAASAVLLVDWQCMAGLLPCFSSL